MEVAGDSGFDSRDDAELRNVLDCEETLLATSMGTAEGNGGIDFGAGGGGTEGGGVNGGNFDMPALRSGPVRVGMAVFRSDKRLSRCSFVFCNSA